MMTPEEFEMFKLKHRLLDLLDMEQPTIDWVAAEEKAERASLAEGDSPRFELALYDYLSTKMTPDETEPHALAMDKVRKEVLTDLGYLDAAAEEYLCDPWGQEAYDFRNAFFMHIPEKDIREAARQPIKDDFPEYLEFNVPEEVVDRYWSED
jgi:hypothetical protein